MAFQPLVDEEYEQIDNNYKVKGLDNKIKWDHSIDKSRKSLSAASVNNTRTLLTREQLLDCADIYANNGIVRMAVDKTVWFILGERVRFVIEPNDELIQGMDDEETRETEQRLKSKYRELHKSLLRIHKRVEFHDRLSKFVNNIEVFGRGFQEIVRFPKTPEWPKFGEPRALRPLTPLRIVDIGVDQSTYDFKGLYYNFGIRGQEKKFLSSDKLIAGWYDDNGVFDNTYYSGMSPVWTTLSAGQTIETIMDENAPEFVKAIAEGFGFLYTGTNKKSVATDIKNTLEKSTWLIHNYKDLKPEKIDLARDPNELMDMTKGLSQYVCQCLNLPLFLLFEDTANFATANQVMQTYKQSTIVRYRTWLRGVLEKYWYDPILADYFNVELEDVIAQEIKIKPIFEDLNFETRKEIIEGDQMLFNIGVLDNVDIADDIGRKDIVRKLEAQNRAINVDERAEISQELKIQQIQEANKAYQQSSNSSGQKKQPPPKQNRKVADQKP